MNLARRSTVWLFALLHRSQSQPEFVRGLLLHLLDIAQAAAAPYAWLAGREAGQGSAANSIKVAVWQALCLLAPWLDDDLAQGVRSPWWNMGVNFGVIGTAVSFLVVCQARLTCCEFTVDCCSSM